MRRTAWLGMAVILGSLPRPAFAFEGGVTVVSTALSFAAAGVIAALIYRGLGRRLERAEAERDRLAAALAEAGALMASAPAALCRWSCRDGTESLMPGGVPAFAAMEGRSFADLLRRLDRDDAASLEAAVARLRAGGTEFALPVSLAAGTALLDVAGRRLHNADGRPLDDLVWFTDATGRAVALNQREAVRGERDRLRALLDALPLPVWRREATTLALVDCNRAYAQAVDAPPAAAIAEGREIAAGVVGDQGRALAARARSTATAQSESHHIVVGGSRRLVEFTEVALPGGRDLVGYARDFTDLENIQAELARHIDAHAEVLESVAAGIAIYGPDTRLTFFNSAFAALWRLEEEWLEGEPTLEEVLERLRERRRIPEHADFRPFKQQLLAMFTSLIEPRQELMHLPDERTLRVGVAPHPFGGLTFVYEDVTDKLALERSYNTLIEVQRETLDNLYEAIAVYGSDGRLKLSNPNYAQIWRLDAEDLAGEPHVADLVEKTRAFFDSGEDWPLLKRRIIARITSHAASSLRLQRSDGSVFQASTVPLPDGNVLLSYLNVTDSTRVERALRERNEALEMAGRLKSEFIANVSYELRTPLNAIIGFAEILAHQYFGALNPRQLEHAQGILESSQRLLSLINDILDLATIEAGYMRLETQEIDLHAMMSSVLVLARERAREQRLSLVFDCPQEIGALTGDERRLKQALFALVSNALKFTPPDGRISLSARRLEADQGGEVALTVADTGVGVPREDQARIFEKFERGNRHARQSGPGLGLSLVKSIVELHGGRVELLSRPGSGTTVTCFLPAAPPAAAAGVAMG